MSPIMFCKRWSFVGSLVITLLGFEKNQELKAVNCIEVTAYFSEGPVQIRLINGVGEQLLHTDTSKLKRLRAKIVIRIIGLPESCQHLIETKHTNPNIRLTQVP